NGILGVGALVLDEMGATPEGRELQEMFDVSGRRILALLDDALLLTQMEVDGNKFAFAPTSLSKVLHAALDQVTEFARSRQVKLESPTCDFGLVLGEEALLVRALQALVEAAVKFSTSGETVRLALLAADDSVNLIIESRGRTIPVSVIGKFFDLFSISEVD